MLRVLGDKVVVKRSEAPSTSKGGIVLPEQSKGVPNEGAIVATGPKAESLAVGDRIIFAAYAGTSIKYEGADLIVMTVDDVIAVMED